MTEALLHNMSARPRTSVSYRVPRLRSDWVSFTWGDPLPELNRRVIARLDRRWVETGLRGGVIVHGMTGDLRKRTKPTPCTDLDLLLNVLLRTRGSLLLAAMPLIDDPSALVGGGIATDDPRLVALVRSVA